MRAPWDLASAPDAESKPEGTQLPLQIHFCLRLARKGELNSQIIARNGPRFIVIGPRTIYRNPKVFPVVGRTIGIPEASQKRCLIATHTATYVSNQNTQTGVRLVVGHVEKVALRRCPLSPFRSISIVIPAYNEAERLGPTLDCVVSFAETSGWNAEIIVVDDGSTDGTADLVRSYARKRGTIRLVQNPGNHGKGYSVRNGVLNAGGEFILFTDADMSSPIEEAPKLLGVLAEGADIAIGSRWARSELQTRRQSLTRQFLGRVFNLLLRMILRLDFKDTQCGFKAFRREAARAVFPRQSIEGWGFDPEILFLAHRAGFRIVEVPVRWGHDTRTRINPLLDGARMVSDMLLIRWNSISGKYRESARPVVQHTQQQRVSTDVNSAA
jgi:dolichyl-phosphate beta-glucosyltransferase